MQPHGIRWPGGKGWRSICQRLTYSDSNSVGYPNCSAISSVFIPSLTQDAISQRSLLIADLAPVRLLLLRLGFNSNRSQYRITLPRLSPISLEIAEKLIPDSRSRTTASCALLLKCVTDRIAMSLPTARGIFQTRE